MYKVMLDGYVLYHAEHPYAMLTEPILELEPGYAGVFTATVPPDNPLYERIFCRRSMLSVFRDDTEIFYGEVRKVPKIDRYKNKSIYCTGALSFLADSIQPQAEYHDISPAMLLKTMLDIHNSQVEQRKQIHLGQVTITDPNNSLYRYTNYENTLEAIRDKLVERLGGYLRLRHENGKLYLDWVSIEEYGNYSNQPIEFGLNLLDYSETTSAEDVITALIPLGATLEDETDIEAPEKRVDITSVNDGKNYVYSQSAIDQFGWVWATNTWEDVTLPKNLKRKAEEWLSGTQFETMSLTLTAADLSELGQDYDAFAVGDRIHCLAKPYGMDIVLPVMKLTIPLQDPAGRTLELSTKQQKTYTSQQSTVKNQLLGQQSDIISASNRNIQLGIENLTAMMTGAKGGYKLSEYDEAGRWVRDLYMDTPDKATAKRILRINKDGIAASTSGYEGPYTVGITVDGQIQGSWIAANSIDTDHLSIGLNTTIQGLEDGMQSVVRKDGIISAINQTSEEVSINASSIHLKGEGADILRSIQMTGEQIGFYKGETPCGFVGLKGDRDIKMSLFTGENEGAMHIHPGWVELPIYTVADGDFTVYGTIGRSVQTEDYGLRSLYAYEMTAPYFGDMGEGSISEDGLCYVPMDPVFAQCVSPEGYQVFLQAYGEGEVHIESRSTDHFVVSGTPGLSFGWEIKAKQADTAKHGKEAGAACDQIAGTAQNLMDPIE